MNKKAKMLDRWLQWYERRNCSGCEAQGLYNETRALLAEKTKPPHKPVSMKPALKIFQVQGWGRPGTAKKHHYFIKSRSLCGKWALLGGILNDSNSDIHSPDDCKSCRRRLDKIK